MYSKTNEIEHISTIMHDVPFIQLILPTEQKVNFVKHVSKASWSIVQACKTFDTVQILLLKLLLRQAF